MQTHRPALRPGVGAAVDTAGRLRMIKFSSSTHLVYDVAPPALDLVALLDGTHSTPELLSIVQESHPQVRADDISQILKVLEAEDLLERGGLPDAALSGLERSVYRRQLDFLADFADESRHQDGMQRRLRDARVAVLGLGGTGTWVAQSLALCGIGALRVLDADVVEPSNLARQVLYGIDDVGAAKGEVAVLHLRRQLGELCSVESVARRIAGPEDVADFVIGCDLVVNCTDEPDINTTSDWVAASCTPRGIPHLVGGGYDGHVGMIGPTIVPFHTACWSCVQAEHRRRWPQEQLTYLTPTRRRHTGALAPLAAVVTNLQVWDAVRVLTGCGAPILANRVGEIDFADLSITWTDVPRDAECSLCGNGRDL